MSEQTSFRRELAQLIKARFPVLLIETHEEQRVLSEITAVATDAEQVRNPRKIYRWSLTDGLLDGEQNPIGQTKGPLEALTEILNRETEPAVFVFVDLHTSLGDQRRLTDPTVVRAIRDIAAAFQNGEVARTLIMVAPQVELPIDLQKDVTIVDFPLPGAAQIGEALDGIVAANSHSGRIAIDLPEGDRERLIDAARGLTLQETENAIALAIVEDGKLSANDVDIINAEKQQTIRKSGLLEFVDAQINLDDVGGLENLKRWLGKRKNSWMAEAAAYGLPAPRGVLITGVPGCGKSLTAKAVASAWHLPLLRFDIGKVFSGLVGSSEQNMRTAIQAAEAVSPCVLWIDEIEKGFSGVMQSHDSGTSSRVFGSFLTWMQEKKAPVFVIATANNIDALPPELLRKGRFDEIFFVDLPTAVERDVIWRLHLGKRLANPRVEHDIDIDANLAELVNLSKGWSGAEIEQAVISAMFDSYSGGSKLTMEDLRHAADTMVPLAVTQPEQIARLRAWADERAVAATSREDRAGYTVTAQATAAQPPKTAERSDESRGGRIVDF